MKKAIITGATGMIGIALTKLLLSRNIELLLIVNPNSRRIPEFTGYPRIKVLKCDLADLSTISSKISNTYDTIFHLAWAGTYGDSRNNLKGQVENIKYTLDAIELAHKVGCNTFIGAGSQAEYGRVYNKKLSPDTPAFPENGYGIAKLCAGQMSRIQCQKYNIRHVWCRILSVYGPHDGLHTMVMSGICQLLRGEKPKFTKGEQLWDYIYCDDVANTLYLLNENGRDGSIYCIGSGDVKPMKEYIITMRDIINPCSEIGFGEIPYYENQVMYLCADISDLEKDTGFKPMTNFREGIIKTVEWVKKEQVYEKN